MAIAAATGMGGIGKTQLAWQYAENHKNLYPGGIWWLRAESFGQQVFSYGQRMGLPTPPEITQEAEQMQWFYDQWLLQIPVGERLLVVDDVQDYGKLKPLLPSDQRFRVLLTTRKRLGSPVQVLEVPKLPLEKALELLEQLGVAAARLQAEPEAVQSLYDWVDGLPLGIELMGRYLAQRRGLKLGELLQRLETKKLSAKALENLPEEMTYENNIRAAFDLSWEPLSQRAKQLGGLLSIFAVAPISLELLQNCLPEEDPEDLEDALHEELVRGSLVDELDPKVYQVHSLLHKFYGEKLGTELADRAETLQRSFAETLNAVAKTIGETLTQADIPRVTETLPHLEIVANNFTYLLENSIDKICSSIGLARVAQFQSRWQDTERWYKKSLEISETQLGTNHPHTATSLNNLASLYYATGRYSEAEPLYRRSLHIIKTQLGADHPHTATSLNNLASLYESMGRYSDAEFLHKRSLHICETQLGADHPLTATSFNNLAGLYRAMGRYSDVESLYVRSLQIREAQLGADHPDTAGSLNNLAAFYQFMGRYSDAEPFCLRTLEIWTKSLGENHPNTQMAWGNFRYLLQQALAHGSADSLSSHPLTQQLLQELRERSQTIRYPEINRRKAP